MAADALFRPFHYKSLNLRNRVVMAPMTRSFSPGGIPTQEVVDYYERRAAADVGLIVSEGTGVDRGASTNDPNVPKFCGDEALAGWQKVIDAVQAKGGAMAPQLWHVGAVRNRRTEWVAPGPIDSPSGLSSPGKQFGQAMSDADVADAIASFARAAADAKRLGFESIELHGAHGYLIDQFFWDGTNVREDSFGGTALAERARFAAEIIKACRAAVGEDFAIIIRLSQWKQQDFAVKMAHTPKEMEAWLQPMADAGADIFHCSQRRFWEPEFEGSDLNFAGWAKKLIGQPTITVGSVGLTGEFVAGMAGEGSKPASLDALLTRLENDEFDLVGVGRALLVDPYWVEKVRDGRDAELLDYNTSALGTLF
jgi:2,4-dienoyl-CoA reductase-like NADH-dependent reductase (Old Yellow Enzyme family)